MTRLIDADALLEEIDKIAVNHMILSYVKGKITNAPTVQREGWIPKLGDLVHPSKEICQKYTEWKETELLKIVGINYKQVAGSYGKYSDIVELTVIELANDYGATDGWKLVDVVPALPTDKE